MQTAAVEKVTPLLRQDQIEDMESEAQAAEQKLRSPNFLGDKGIVAEGLRALQHQLETQRPKPYTETEIDAAVKREAELRAMWTQGMLSMEEMRKCPPGAVDRHRAWELKNKKLITEWKNIQRRLNVGNPAREMASIERFRPTVSTMNMDGAKIPGKQIYLPPVTSGLPVTFSDVQIALIRELNPAIADMLGGMDNKQRAKVKQVIANEGNKMSVKSYWTPERRAAFGAKMKAARAAKG